MRESDGLARRGLSRRRVLELSAAAALALAGTVAGVARTSGYPLSPDRRLVAMPPWQFVVAQHAARRIAALDAQAEKDGVPTADDVDAAGFVDAWLVKMPPRVRRDFGRFLAYIEHLAPIRAGLASRFTRLDPSAQDRVLAATESSSSTLLRAGFDGLKALVMMGYYRDPRAWGVVSYDGPLVGRPLSGWRDER